MSEISAFVQIARASRLKLSFLLLSEISLKYRAFSAKLRFRNFLNFQMTEIDFYRLFFQVLGMSLGAVIMLLIALYEHDMKTLFENHQPHHHD